MIKFGIDPIPGVDPGSVFHFLQHNEIEHFTTFSRICHTDYSE